MYFYVTIVVSQVLMYVNKFQKIKIIETYNCKTVCVRHCKFSKAMPPLVPLQLIPSLPEQYPSQ